MQDITGIGNTRYFTKLFEYHQLCNKKTSQKWACVPATGKCSPHTECANRKVVQLAIAIKQ
jgi:hypothetical protein